MRRRGGANQLRMLVMHAVWSEWTMRSRAYKKWGGDRKKIPAGIVVSLTTRYVSMSPSLVFCILPSYYDISIFLLFLIPFFSASKLICIFLQTKLEITDCRLLEDQKDWTAMSNKLQRCCEQHSLAPVPLAIYNTTASLTRRKWKKLVAEGQGF